MVVPAALVQWTPKPANITGSGATSKLVNQGTDATDRGARLWDNDTSAYVDIAANVTSDVLVLPTTTSWLTNEPFAASWGRTDTIFTIGCCFVSPQTGLYISLWTCRQFITFTTNATYRGWALYRADTGKWSFQTMTSGGVISTKVCDTTIANGATATIAVKVNGATSTFYLNGVSASQSGGSVSPTYTANTRLWSGYDSGNGLAVFRGSATYRGGIKDQRYWNSALSDAEILEWHNEVAAPAASGPRWRRRSAGGIFVQSSGIRAPGGSPIRFNKPFRGGR